jgi:monovalent cation/hydrogen antiporter
MMPEHLELVIFGLLVAVAGFVVLSRLLRVPYPIFLVIGGLVLSLVPVLPEITLPPDLVFLIFLPPLLYSAAFFSSPRDLRANIRPITLLALGLVLLTTATVAVVGHLAIGLPWPVAFVLGVVVSPTDPAAVMATAERFGLPRRILTILEGESLINDGTALVLYRTVVMAAVAGSFSIFEAGAEFVLGGIGGAAIGLAVGWVISRARRWVEDPLVETTIALFTGYASYIPAEELGASGVLAVVAAGLYLSLRSPRMSSARNRLHVFEVLEVMNFLLNSLLFILVGLQLPAIFGRLSGESPATLILYAALVSLAVVGTRLLWTFPMAYLPRRLSRRLRERDPLPPGNRSASSPTRAYGVRSL